MPQFYLFSISLSGCEAAPSAPPAARERLQRYHAVTLCTLDTFIVPHNTVLLVCCGILNSFSYPSLETFQHIADHIKSINVCSNSK